MNYHEAIGEQYCKETIGELSGEVYLDRYPSLANKCNSYREAKVFTAGQVFRNKEFHHCTIFGGAQYHDCYFDDVMFSPMDGRESQLCFFGGVMRNCVIIGHWHMFMLSPQFCKDVKFGADFLALDSTIRFSCPVVQGLVVPQEVWMRLTVLMGKSLGITEYEPESPLAKAKAEIDEYLTQFGETL